MEEIEKSQVGGHFRIMGGGIDTSKLIHDKEIEFEMENPIEDKSHDYFDGEKMFKSLNFECTNAGDDSDNDSDQTPFQRMAAGMEDITPSRDGGVLKKILIPGVGSIIPQGASCKVHYNAYLEYSEEPFDSSILRNSQMVLKLGSGEQILGWEIALVTMKKNEKSRFLFSPAYAFGKMGCPPRIPAGATVMFEIEVQSFVDGAKADEFERSTKEEREKMTFNDRLCLADSLRQKGNDEFSRKRVQQAFRSYKTAIQQLENCRLANEEEEIAMKKSCLNLYLNASLCSLRMGNWGSAAHFARKALGIERNNVKAHYRLGKAMGQMAEFSEARRHLLDAQALAPSNKEIRDELRSLNNKCEEFRQMHQTIYTSSQPGRPLQSKKVENEDNSARNAMLEYIKDKISEFKQDQSQDVLHLPPSLKADELEDVRSLAKTEGFEVENDENGIPCLKKK